MKVVILAGGFGTRLSEETAVVPKPMVEIGGMPILWHIMKHYAHHGYNDFIVCCGYRATVIKKYFRDFPVLNSDFTIDLANDEVRVVRRRSEDWKVTLVDTGLETMTGGRIKRVGDLLDGTFCLTYGDGVSDLDISALVAFHEREGTLATVSAVQQPGRFGALDLSPDATRVRSFREKSMLDGTVINGGFFVLEPAVLDRIEGDGTVWEQEPLKGLAADGQLSVYRHHGYWQNMDTLRDKQVLEAAWQEGRAPWAVWDR